MTTLNSNSKLMARPLPVDIMVALYDFQGRDHDELTVKEGQLLSLEDNRRVGDWARVRSRVDPDAPSGLVPWTYIQPKKPSFRASALYNFARQKSDEVEMALGQAMSVYGTSGTRFLVKLDDFNGRVGRVGFVPQNYVEAFQDGQKEDLGPNSSKDLPERGIFTIRCITNAHNAGFRMGTSITFVRPVQMTDKHASSIRLLKGRLTCSLDTCLSTVNGFVPIVTG
ncbi:hypothetical protein M407DRAFT_170186 [Tulasnella calospora MUT 4182]|uniref:SH3 domain-containing protein n=1 Tax=Tulasnella calospora MUT 4182 TaxID=1051891 RepID=A0A0C3Q488_9AGAM|nr:hypothetical protein M407DRAFT_170186 [Tulasnella calospora MUT 4182]